MAAGNIISKYQGYQDYRRMGGGIYSLTLEITVLILSISCLGGLPFLLGFFNKHYLVLLIPETYNFMSVVFLFGAAFTGLFYTVKTVLSLLNSYYKTPKFNVNSFNSGLVVGKPLYSPVTPMTNVLLFGGYPIIICILSLFVLNGDF
jgi:NADH:ubiquinone oxidoreductase subunit 5 (subunit L)/multisubunit Na+/H+ antiporter MnhA subunit